jgi:predicted nucleotidyltransferase
MDNGIMPSETLPELLVKARAAVLTELPDCQAIYVFGSRAQSQSRDDSDLDIAVLLPAGNQLPDRLSLIARLSSVLGVEVDVVDLHRASDVLRREVLASGIRIHASDPDISLAWEAHAMTRYGHYRHEVAELLAEFHATGQGYGP